MIGIQCKSMDEHDENNHPRPGGKILKTHLDKESCEALKFQSQLKTWILATTAKRDATIQKYASELDEKSRASGAFGIQVWFWDDFITDLNRHHDLQEWYYCQVIQVRSSDDQDRIILELIGEAFSRPAFRTPLHLETPSEFLQSLKDTQQAINTGVLKDRETGQVIRKAIAGRRAVENKAISDHLRETNVLLQQLRDEFTQNLGGTIV